MAIEEPFDLLIECADCGIENVFSGYTPEQLVLCNQCRNRLIHSEFSQTHNEYRCEDCGFVMCLAKETPFDKGKTACRCKSFNIQKAGQSEMYEEAEEAGAFGTDEVELDTDPGEDWCRSDLSSLDVMEDYNEMFDQEPGDS